MDAGEFACIVVEWILVGGESAKAGLARACGVGLAGGV